MFTFATCQWEPFGKRFLQKMYPSIEIDEKKIPKLVSLIEKDVLRIQDPDFHSPCQIIAGGNHKDSEHAKLIEEAITEFKREVHDKD